MLKKAVLVFSLFSSLNGAIATSHFDIDCAENGLKPKVEPKPLAERVSALDANGKKLYDGYKSLDSSIQRFLTDQDLLMFAEETDATVFRGRMQKLIEGLQGKPDAQLESEIKKIAQQILSDDHFSVREISARFQDWKAIKGSRWFRLLGDRSLDEVRSLYLGSTPGKISSTSLIGRYIEATQANVRKIRVPIAPGSTELGPEKWIVPVSARSFDEFKKIAQTDYFISILGHAAILKNAEIITHLNAASAMRLPRAGTPLPMLILKTSESERLNRYLELVKSGKFELWYDELKQPWMAGGYCKRGVYDCCTHWIGNLPIGDTLVSEYVFPAGEELLVENGQYVIRNGKHVFKPLEPIIAPLSPWVPENERQKQLTSIWKVPGNMQLSEMIGQKAANIRGEFASPGWVIRTLMGPTTEERVPVIFYVVDDHTAPIADSPYFNYEQER